MILLLFQLLVLTRLELNISEGEVEDFVEVNEYVYVFITNDILQARPLILEAIPTDVIHSLSLM